MQQVNLDKDKIEALIPHSGGMCLLEKVISYSESAIICETSSHLLLDNPLKINGKLSKMHLIEYGAQAIAIHGGLIEKQSLNNLLLLPKIGYITLIKSVTWGRFDSLTAKLTIKATVQIMDERVKRYDFSVMDFDQLEICSGNVMVVLP